MKPQEFLRENEFIGDDAHQMHKSHQLHMLREECYHSAANAIKLHKLLGELPEGHDLDAWAAEKISLANDYLKTVTEWLEYDVMGGTNEAMMAGGMEAFSMESAERQYAELLGEDQGVAEGYDPDGRPDWVPKARWDNWMKQGGFDYADTLAQMADPNRPKAQTQRTAPQQTQTQRTAPQQTQTPPPLTPDQVKKSKEQYQQQQQAMDQQYQRQQQAQNPPPPGFDRMDPNQPPPAPPQKRYNNANATDVNVKTPTAAQPMTSPAPTALPPTSPAPTALPPSMPRLKEQGVAEGSKRLPDIRQFDKTVLDKQFGGSMVKMAQALKDAGFSNERIVQKMNDFKQGVAEGLQNPAQEQINQILRSQAPNGNVLDDRYLDWIIGPESIQRLAQQTKLPLNQVRNYVTAFCQNPDPEGIEEGEITRTATGTKHRSTAAYGGTEKDTDHLRTLDKATTNKIDKAIGVKFKKQGRGLDLGETTAAGSVSTVPAVGGGTLFGGNYSNSSSPFKKKSVKKESIIKR